MLLTIEDIIAKKEALKERKKEKKCLIHCEALGGELEVHGLSKGDMADVRAAMKEDAQKGTYKFIYMSIDYLRDNQVLENYSCKTNSINIVEKIFTEAEVLALAGILRGINGLGDLKPNEIYKKEIEEAKN